MTVAELERLVDLVENRDDELGRLTRKLLALWLSERAISQSGDVDQDGEIVDRSFGEDLLARLRRSISEFRSSDVDPESQLELTLGLLAGLP